MTGLSHLIEVKLSAATLSLPLIYFDGKIEGAFPYQLVHNLRQEQNIKGISVLSAGRWLSE